MTAQPKIIHVRVDVDLHEEASAVLKSHGMSMSDAVNFFLYRVAKTQSFPPELKVPNEGTKQALAEARSMRLTRRKAAAGP